MNIRNCPECRGEGKERLGHRWNRCGFCHGKKKVSSEYCKWEKVRTKLEEQMTIKWETWAKISSMQKINEKMKEWDTKHPKPRKFPTLKPASRSRKNK